MKNLIDLTSAKQVVLNQFNKVVNSHDVYSKQEVLNMIEDIRIELDLIKHESSFDVQGLIKLLKDQMSETVRDFEFEGYVSLDLNQNRGGGVEIDIEVDCTNDLEQELDDTIEYTFKEFLND